MPSEAGAAVHTETAMAPGAGGSHPAADVLGTKLNFLLESLKELEAGRARIVNLFDGLKATHVCPDHVRQLVAALPPPQSDTWEIYRDLLDHIRGFHQTLYFRRPSPPVWDRPIALVVERSLFDQESPPSNEVNADPSAKKPFRLFSEQYIRAAKSQRRVQEPVTNKTELVDLLEYLREGLRNGLADRGLGAAGRVVFFTPVDTLWEELTAARFRGDSNPFPDPGPANRVCDFLGLPYRNCWLVELRSRSKLGDLVEQGKLTLAAPTVIEAWAHDYFRHWPREDAADPWGRTLHVGDGLVGRAESEGRPEAIVDHLSPTLLSADFEVSILGRVTARQIPMQKDVNEFLTSKRELTVMVQEIVARVAPSCRPNTI